MHSLGNIGMALRSGCVLALVVMSSALRLDRRSIPGTLVASMSNFSVGGEARTRGCGLPSYTRKVELAFIQTRMKDFAHIPQLCFKDLLIKRRRFCESHSQRSDP